jgi:hypothetical protein
VGREYDVSEKLILKGPISSRRQRLLVGKFANSSTALDTDTFLPGVR